MERLQPEDITPEDITVVEEPLQDEPLGGPHTGLLGAYNSLGFEQGYSRATRNLIAMLPLLVEEFEREYVGVTKHDREVVKLFARLVEERLESSKVSAVVQLAHADAQA